MHLYTILVLIALIQLLDIHSTALVLEKGGKENNPIMAKVMELCGNYWPIGKLIIAFSGIFCLYVAREGQYTHLIASGFLVVYVYTVIKNYHWYRKLK